MPINATKIIDRLKIAMGIKKDLKFAKKIGVNPSTLSGWKKRNTLDWPKVLEEVKNFDANYILFGKTRHGDELVDYSKVEEKNVEYIENDINGMIKDIIQNDHKYGLESELKAQIIITLLKSKNR